MKYLDTKKGSLEEAIQQSMSGVVAKDLIEAGGKYLKYSDLLLQKGRLMAKGANTAMIDKEISKEMKKLGIKESKDEYEKFFNSALKKFKIDSPADLKTDAKKKEFFNYVDKNYKAKEEELDKEDTPTVKKVVKMLKKASKAHADQAKTLSKDLQDEVLHETEIEFDPTDFKQNRGPISNKEVTDTVKRLQKEFPGIKGKKTGKMLRLNVERLPRRRLNVERLPRRRLNVEPQHFFPFFSFFLFTFCLFFKPNNCLTFCVIT